MAEIKSTLELVMEKTRNLCMTEEDKQKQVAREFRETVSRLTLKYLDRQIDLDKFKAELDRFGEVGSLDKTDGAFEIGKRIDPAADNTDLLDLIKLGLGFDVSGIEAALHHFKETLHREEDREAERVRVDLLGKGISGRAVIPNLEADKEWTKRRAGMLEAVREELAAQIAGFRQCR